MIRQYLVNLFAALLGVAPVAPPVASSAEQSPTIGAAVAARRGRHRSILSAALHDSRFRFRSIGALVKAINSAPEGEPRPESYVVELLREMPARQERDNPQLWGAVDVVGAGELGSNPPPAAQPPQELAARAGNPPAVDYRAQHKTTLAAALHDSRFRFRSITALAEAIAQPESYTVELLREMPARQEQGKAHLWGAVDVVGAGRDAGRPRSYAYAGDESE